MARQTPKWDAFRTSARKMQPTKAHRPAVWENMLGTVYARNAAGETRYFDYDWDAAIEFVGEVSDVRVARAKYHGWTEPGNLPRNGQLAWFVVDGKPGAEVEAYGVRGVRSKPWRRTFKNLDALNAWVEKSDGDIEVHGTREVEESR